MKILLTGMTTSQCGRRTKVQYATFATLLGPALRLAGHEVDQRAVLPEEDLDGYDLLLTGVLKVNSIAANYRYGALSAIWRRYQEGALGIYLDDWRLREIHTGFNTIIDKPARLTNAHFSSGPTHEWALRHLTQLGATCEVLYTHEWPDTIMPTFTWGNHGRLLQDLPGLREDRVTCVDPSSLALQSVLAGLPPVRSSREPVHLVAALTRISGDDNGEWPKQNGATWPVEVLGNGGEKVPESAVLTRYGEVTTTVSLPYRHKGSGWWRNRFDFAAERGCLMLCDPAETVNLHPQFTLTPGQAEQLTTTDRDRWAEFQREMLRSQRQPMNDFLEAVDSFVRRAAAAPGRAVTLERTDLKPQHRGWGPAREDLLRKAS